MIVPAAYEPLIKNALVEDKTVIILSFNSKYLFPLFAPDEAEYNRILSRCKPRFILRKKKVELMKMIDLTYIDMYRDGGTKRFKGNDGNIYYQDFRIGSKTRGSFFEFYPSNFITPVTGVVFTFTKQQNEKDY